MALVSRHRFWILLLFDFHKADLQTRTEYCLVFWEWYIQDQHFVCSWTNAFLTNSETIWLFSKISNFLQKSKRQKKCNESFSFAYGEDGPCSVVAAAMFSNGKWKIVSVIGHRQKPIAERWFKKQLPSQLLRTCLCWTQQQQKYRQNILLPPVWFWTICIKIPCVPIIQSNVLSSLSPVVQSLWKLVLGTQAIL